MAKHLKLPTKKQKIFMSKKGLNWENWMVERDTPEKMVVVHRHSDREETLTKKIAM